MCEVYFLSSEIPVKSFEHWSNPKLSTAYRLRELAEKSGFGDFVEPGDIVALKVHFGDHGTTRTVRSVFIRQLAGLVRKLGGEPFVTETTGLGMLYHRNSAPGRIKIARENGYTNETLNAPIIIADGLRGFDFVSVEAEPPLNEVALARAIHEADKVVLITHVTAHMGSGFGGAIKNLGVGCVAKPTKFDLHHYDKPEIVEERCTRCGECQRICPSKAISPPKLDKEKCIKCDGCSEACRYDAIEVEWTSPDELNRRIVRSAEAVMKAKGRENIFYFNFLLEVTPHCDCFSFSSTPIAEAGILASRDLLAIDKASIDIIGHEKLLSLYPEADFRVQIEEAERQNLGCSEYKLIRLPSTFE